MTSQSSNQTSVRPALTPVVYLRGARRKGAMWERVEHAMWERGWYTERDRTTAWHLARGGAPVILCDFSADLYREEPASGTDYHQYVVVGRVRARYIEHEDIATVGDLLESSDLARLMREQASWLRERVRMRTTDHDLPLTNGGETDAPLSFQGLDVDELVRLVAEALED